jgi:uncharacterized protein (TIGR04255 family)
MSALFPRAPLAATIFQLRFGGEMSVEAARPLIQDAVRADLPKVFVPKVVAGTAPALQGYAFRSEDASEGVDLAINSFVYMTYRYPGFQGFRERCLKFWSVFQRHVVVHRPNRLGLRYVNHIPILRESKSAGIPLDDYLTVDVVLPAMVMKRPFTEFSLNLQVPALPGQMRIQIEHQTPDEGQELLQLDFDYSERESIDLNDLNGFLERAHAMTKHLFLEIVTPQYLELIRKGD